MKRFRFSGGSALSRRFLNGASWSFCGTFISQLILMGTTAILSRMLIKEEFAAYILLQSTLATVGIFVGLGFGTLVTRYSAALRWSEKIRLERIISLGYVCVIIFSFFSVGSIFLFSDKLALVFFKKSEFGLLLSVSSFSIAFTTIDNYQKSVLIGFEKLSDVAATSIIGAILSIIFLISMGKYFGIIGVAFGISLSSLLQVVVSTRVVRRIFQAEGIAIYNKYWSSEFGLVISFGLPALLANLIVPLALWAAQAMLARAENGYSELALFGVGMQWFNAIMFVPFVANRVLMPLLTDLAEKRAVTDAIGVVRLAYLINFGFTFSIACIFCLLSKKILLLYGGYYPNGWIVLSCIAGCAVLSSLTNVTGNLISAYSKMWLGSVMNFSWALVFLIGSAVFLMNGFGALGVAIALMIAYLSHVGWSVIITKNILSTS